MAKNTRVVQKSSAIQISNKMYNLIGARIRKLFKWLIDGGGKKGIVYVHDTTGNSILNQ